MLKNWDVSNPKAYAHYQRSMQLQAVGRVEKAIAQVARATELDLLDSANHFTLGSVKDGIGADTGNVTLVREALESCCQSDRLDPNWFLPWTEIGWNLLKAVRPECRPLDDRYYAALASGYWAATQKGRTPIPRCPSQACPCIRAFLRFS